MYSLSPGDWNAPIPGDASESVNAYNVEIKVLRKTETTVLHYSHVVLALLRAINDMSSQNTYCQSFVYIFLNEKHIGVIIVGPRGGLTQTLAADEKGDGPLSLAQSDMTTTNSSSLTLSSEIIDPAYQHVNIEYQTDGDAIGSRYVFLVVLDGIARTAQFPANSHCSGFHAMDPDLHAVFHIGSSYDKRFRLQLLRGRYGGSKHSS